MIRVTMPQHLRTLAGVDGPVEIELDGAVTPGAIIDVLESRYPALRGAIRDHRTRERRPFLRFFACQRDLSHQSPDEPVPEEVASGEKPFHIVGAIAGG